MLSLFRLDHPIILLVVLLYWALLSLAGFLEPMPATSEVGGFLGQALIQWVGPGLSNSILHFLLVFSQGFLLNYLVNTYRLNRENTYFLVVFYVFTVAAVYPAFVLTAPLIGVTFLLIMLFELFGVYKAKNTAGKVFNIGFWVAVASLFYLPWMLFLIFGLIGLVVLNVLDLKSLIILLIGFFVPYFLMWTYLFSFEQGHLLWSQHFGDNLSFLDLSGLGNLDFYYRIGLLGLVMVLGLLNWNHFLFRTKIQVQKYFSLLFYFLIFGGLSFFLQKGVGTEHLIIICVPISVFLGLSMLRIKTRPIAEFIHLIMIIALIGFQFREQLIDLLISSGG